MSILFIALTVLLAGGVLCLVLHHRCRVMQLLYILCTFAGSLLGLYALIVMVQHGAPASVTFSWLQVLHLSLALDSLSAAFLLPIFLLSPLIALYSHHYLAQPSTTWKLAVQYFFVSLLMASMVLVAVADNMLTFALAWELMSVSSFVLVIFDHEKEESRRAGYLYLLFTQTGALFLFAAFGLLFASTGSLAFIGFEALPHGIKLTVFCLALVCFGSKAGVFPLHIWLPHAHPAAPSHVSALLSGVMIKMGVYGILRIYLLLEDPSPVFAYIVLICGLTSGVLGVAYALGKHDIKRLLAYHSIENIGIILTGAGLGMLGVSSGNRIMAAFGFAGCLLHVLNHALFKSLLFMGAGAVLQQTGTRHLDQLGGLMKTMPVTGWTFLTGSVAISGLPPLNGFISEFLIYYAAFQGLSHSGPVFLLSLFTIIALALIGGLASACFTKVVGVVFLGEPRNATRRAADESGWTMQSAMIILALACLLIGLWPEPFLHFAFVALRDIAPAMALTPDLLGSLPENLALAARFFVGLMLLLTVFRRLLYRSKPIRHSATWGCGFSQPSPRMQYTGTSYAQSILEFHRPFVRVQTEYPGIEPIFPGKVAYSSKVEDIAEYWLCRYAVRPFLWGVSKLRWIQHGNIQLYIGYIILAIAVLLLTL